MRIGVYIVFLSLIFLFSCSSSKRVMNDDAVRLKLDSLSLLPEGIEFNPFLEPNTNTPRNSSTLRGNVFHIIKLDEIGEQKKYVVFLDSIAFNEKNPKPELIPLEFVDLQGPKVNLGENWFENYNNPLSHDIIREVDTIYSPKACSCNDLSLPGFQLQCPFPVDERAQSRSWFYSNAKIGIASYNNFNGFTNEDNSQNSPFFELMAGIRLGDYTSSHWILGISYFSGVNVFNSPNGQNINRNVLFLNAKYQFDAISCVFPFVYGQVGPSIDVESLYLGRIALKGMFDGFINLDCDCEADLDADLKLRQELALKSPEVDISIPISWGFGFGVDIPMSKSFDISLDFGYKYLKVGDYRNLFGLATPTANAVSLYTFTLGITY